MKFGEYIPKGETDETKESMPWVQDITKEEAEEMVLKMNAQIETGEIKSPEGSKYKTGPSKSGNKNEAGIYFFDPTASKENDEENLNSIGGRVEASKKNSEENPE